MTYIFLNSHVIQFLSDLLNTPVTNIGVADVSALGAAFIVGLGAAMYENIEVLSESEYLSNSKYPWMNKIQVLRDYEGWKNYISKYF